METNCLRCIFVGEHRYCSRCKRNAIKREVDGEIIDFFMPKQKQPEKDDGMNDNVNHPNHYQGANECIDVMEAMFGREAVKAFCRCNAFKYRFRADKKNGAEDIKKAEWYETRLIEMNEQDNDRR